MSLSSERIFWGAGHHVELRKCGLEVAARRVACRKAKAKLVTQLGRRLLVECIGEQLDRRFMFAVLGVQLAQLKPCSIGEREIGKLADQRLVESARFPFGRLE